MIRLLKNIIRNAICMCFSVVQRIPSSNGILLTFDDGPDPNITPAVLDLLRQYGAKAIFFVCGNRIENAPELLARIVDEGHVLGNHTFSHWEDRVPSWSEYADDVEQNSVMIKSSVMAVKIGNGGGQDREDRDAVKFFRAPHGRLRLAPVLAARKAGLRYIRWSVSISNESWELRDAEEMKRRGEILAHQTKPGDIVLLHDDNPNVLEILKIALPMWKEKGWALNQWMIN